MLFEGNLIDQDRCRGLTRIWRTQVAGRVDSAAASTDPVPSGPHPRRLPTLNYDPYHSHLTRDRKPSRNTYPPTPTHRTRVGPGRSWSSTHDTFVHFGWFTPDKPADYRPAAKAGQDRPPLARHACQGRGLPASMPPAPRLGGFSRQIPDPSEKPSRNHKRFRRFMDVRRLPPQIQRRDTRCTDSYWAC